MTLTPTLACLALAIYFEARNQPVAGKVAVAQVVLNRARHPGFPDDVCAVVKQGGEQRWRCQFTFWCDGIPDRPYERWSWDEAILLADAVLSGSGHAALTGVMWYHADYVSPAWSSHYELRVVIGDHLFYAKGD